MFVTWTTDAEGQLIIEKETSDVVLGQALRRVYPGYPEQARRKRVEGNVVVDAVVSKTGEVVSIKATSGPQALIEASSDSAKGWRWAPTTMNGEPVEVLARITFKYDLGRRKENLEDSAMDKKSH